MESIDLLSVRLCWGNVNFDYVHSDSIGNSGGILCIWDPNSFRKDSVTVLDYFVIVRGVWIKSGMDILIVVMLLWMIYMLWLLVWYVEVPQGENPGGLVCGYRKQFKGFSLLISRKNYGYWDELIVKGILSSTFETGLIKPPVLEALIDMPFPNSSFE
ncbi:hypothetical protein Tco_0146029 [Tanacetum coccineum]